MEDLTPQLWDTIRSKLEILRNTLLDVDASRLLLPKESCLDPDRNPSLPGPLPSPSQLRDITINKQLSETPPFSNDYEYIVEDIKVFLCLSILRQHTKGDRNPRKLKSTKKDQEMIGNYEEQIGNMGFSPEVDALLKKVLEKKENVDEFLRSDERFNLTSFHAKIKVSRTGRKLS